MFEQIGWLWKLWYRRAIKKATKLARDFGLDPERIYSNRCRACGLPMYMFENGRLVCLNGCTQPCEISNDHYTRAIRDAMKIYRRNDYLSRYGDD